MPIDKAYTVLTDGGTVTMKMGFRLVYKVEQRSGCFVWRDVGNARFVLTLLTSPSGSGKSTLLQALHDRVRRKSAIMDESWAAKLADFVSALRRNEKKRPAPVAPLTFDFTPDYQETIKVAAGYIPQNPPRVSHWRVRDLLPDDPKFLDCFLPGFSPADEQKRFGQFSGGQQSRLYACSAAERLAESHADCAFLLLDETFDGLGAVEAARCLVQLSATWAQRSGFPLHLLVVTHLNNHEIIEAMGKTIDVTRLSIDVRSETAQDKVIALYNLA